MLTKHSFKPNAGRAFGDIFTVFFKKISDILHSNSTPTLYRRIVDSHTRTRVAAASAAAAAAAARDVPRCLISVGLLAKHCKFESFQVHTKSTRARHVIDEEGAEEGTIAQSNSSYCDQHLFLPPLCEKQTDFGSFISNILLCFGTHMNILVCCSTASFCSP